MKKWYKLSAKQNNSYSQSNIGYMYGNGFEVNLTKDRKWYHLASKQKDSYAQFYIGYMYHYGKGFVMDYAQAMKWYF